MTWSIQIQGDMISSYVSYMYCPSDPTQLTKCSFKPNPAELDVGRFLRPTNADDCVFGNTFDKPIRDRLPFGTGAALKAISYIDPSLEVSSFFYFLSPSLLFATHDANNL